MKLDEGRKGLAPFPSDSPNDLGTSHTLNATSVARGQWAGTPRAAILKYS